jgi:hypothetical protein
MNSFFLSLIQTDRNKREKNLSLKYKFDIPSWVQSQEEENEYIRTRFPFLTLGDKIEFQSCSLHGGYCLFFYEESNLRNHVSSFFKKHSETEWSKTVRKLTREEIRRLSASNPVRAKKYIHLGSLFESCYYIPRFKMRKTKFEVFIFFFDNESESGEDDFDPKSELRSEGKIYHANLDVNYSGPLINPYFKLKKKIMYIDVS